MATRITEQPGVLEFADFYRAAYPSVRRGLHRIIGDLAEEITQDAFVLTLERWESVREMDAPDAWVWVVARRMALRRLAREIERPVREVRGADRVGSAVDRLPDLDLSSAVARLPQPFQAAVGLHYFCDLPLSEVGSLLGCSPATAKVWLYRARQRLEPNLTGLDGVWVGERIWTEGDIVARARELGAEEYLEPILEIIPGRRARRLLRFGDGRFEFTASDGDWLDGGRFTLRSGVLTLHPITLPGQVAARVGIDGDSLTIRYLSHTTPPINGVPDDVGFSVLLEEDVFVWRPTGVGRSRNQLGSPRLFNTTDQGER